MPLGIYQPIAQLPFGVGRVISHGPAIKDGHCISDGHTAAHMALSDCRDHFNCFDANLGREYFEIH